MSRASELEAKRLSTERIAARCDALLNAGDDAAGISPALVMIELSKQLLSEATHISGQRRSGWKSSSDAHTVAARILERWTAELTEHIKQDVPPMRPPIDLDDPAQREPASGVPSERGQSDIDKVRGAWPDGPITPDAATRVRLAVEAGKDTDGKLDAAFGDRVTAHRQVVDSFVHPPLDGLPAVPKTADLLAAPVHVTSDGYGSTDVTLCGKGGLRGYRGAATCPECIALFDDRSGRRPAAETTQDKVSMERIIAPPQEFGPERFGTVASVRFTDPSEPPKRMTFAEVREHGRARARGADHRSYSQVDAFRQCGIQYALSDLDNVPTWWNVGGTAVHYACERVNRMWYTGTIDFDAIGHQAIIDALWSESFARSTSETLAAHPGVGMSDWRAAKSGAEGYDWWRVEGALMVGRWVARLRALHDDGWTIATIGERADAQAAIEVSLPMTILTGVDDPNGIKVENIIDLVMVRDDTFMIIDTKSGASAPTSTYQLGQYAWAVGRGFHQGSRIVGAWWLARTDTLSYAGASELIASDAQFPDLRELHPWDEIEYLISTMDIAERQGLYLPNKSKSDRFGCGSCGVKSLCPVGPR